MKHVVLIMCLLAVTGCSRVAVDGGQEAVLIAKPYFFGHEGVYPQPVASGADWVAWSTSSVIYDIRPQRVGEQFVDLISSDNIPIDFNAYLIFQIQKGQSPILHENFGTNWYLQKVQAKFRTEIRNFARSQRANELISSVDTVNNGQRIVLNEMMAYFIEQKIPVMVLEVIIGKATPPEALLEEIARTAAQTQRAKTEEQRRKAEIARKSAEAAKAEADDAYKRKFGMTTKEYLQLRALEIEKEKLEVVKGKDNVHIVMTTGGNTATPVFNVGN